jgi:ABC-type glycerol-3-phosphate transport system substrate-binding protein
MDTAYIFEYGNRGALLDLAKYGATSKFIPGASDSGKINGTPYGVNAGINSLVIRDQTRSSPGISSALLVSSISPKTR